MTSNTNQAADPDLARSGIEYVAHRTHETADAIAALVRQCFPALDSGYRDTPIDEYRAQVSAAQDRLCEGGYIRAIVAEILPDLRRHLGEDRFLVQSNLYLRATRPAVPQAVEAVGWHRESFYGPNMERSVNIWTPICGVDANNTLRFIPGSQAVPDSALQIESVEDSVTRRFSAGHRIGFVYAPKLITAGVDLDSSKPMLVPPYHSIVFPGELIHGSGLNHSSTIRFSVDFRVLPLTAWSPELSKRFHFASGKPYFEEY